LVDGCVGWVSKREKAAAGAGVECYPSLSPNQHPVKKGAGPAGTYESAKNSSGSRKGWIAVASPSRSREAKLICRPRKKVLDLLHPSPPPPDQYGLAYIQADFTSLDCSLHLTLEPCMLRSRRVAFEILIVRVRNMFPSFLTRSTPVGR
jgi:hypothetical protein